MKDTHKMLLLIPKICTCEYQQYALVNGYNNHSKCIYKYTQYMFIDNILTICICEYLQYVYMNTHNM